MRIGCASEMHILVLGIYLTGCMKLSYDKPAISEVQVRLQPRGEPSHHSYQANQILSIITHSSSRLVTRGTSAVHGSAYQLCGPALLPVVTAGSNTSHLTLHLLISILERPDNWEGNELVLKVLTKCKPIFVKTWLGCIHAVI